MKARLTWNESRLARSGRSRLRALEWTFLLVGLIALDCYVWINTSSVLYQAYEDWAFDQTLRGLTPGVGGFMHDETRWLLGGGRQKVETAEAPQPTQPSDEASRVAPPGPQSVIGRLEIPRLALRPGIYRHYLVEIPLDDQGILRRQMQQQRLDARRAVGREDIFRRITSKGAVTGEALTLKWG